MSNILDTDIKFLQGVGPKRGELLTKELNIATFKDLLYFFPFRYVDKSKIYTIAELTPQMAYIQIRGVIKKVSTIGDTPKNKRLVISFADSTGTIDLVFFKGLKWIEERLNSNTEYIVFGKPTVYNGTLNIIHPEINTPSQELKYMGGGKMSGIYSSTEKIKNSGIGHKTFATLINTLFSKISNLIEETLPDYILQENKLLSLRESLQNVHFPSDNYILGKAQYRLKFQELFLLQLSLLRQKSIRTRNDKGIVMKVVGEYFNKCYQALPFPLTNAQKRVIKEMRQDMKSGKQMNRLLQGDVGSGKTMVALLCSLIVLDNNYQACLMAPTEVLATQHYKNISKSLAPLGINVALLTGSTKQKERKTLLPQIANGEVQILIGTHALIEDNVEFKNLGLAIIDEQHRFGVEQRSKLWRKGESLPHILVMTATPIPRTLAMTLYGDLDVSVLDELPPGRKPIQTIHLTDNAKYKVYKFVKDEIEKGRQIYIVYPLIKESEKMDYKNLQEGYETIIREFPAPKYITAVVHGKQKIEDKQHDMNLFSSGKADILVATSVIEVGVDVPNASVMIIESAERFGLSQLHQLRGRVGRGSDKSYCILITGYKLSKESRERIELMCKTNDGFELAEADLKMRGPGDLDGTAQSGLALDLKISNLGKDSIILETARNYALKVLEEDPFLELPKNKLLKEQLLLMRDNKNRELISYSKIS